MPESVADQTPARARSTAGWMVAVLWIVVWSLLAAKSADAQSNGVPEIVLAQVLGHVPEVAAPARGPAPAAGDEVQRVAQRMRESFQDQLVAGVRRPSVELEVHFDFDSDEIHEESAPQIEAAAELLNHHFQQQRFRVAGYTDAVGSEAYNQQLSERRAAAVWQRLVEEHGVRPERLERVGFGEADPAEASDAAQHRRVELQILREGAAF